MASDSSKQDSLGWQAEQRRFWDFAASSYTHLYRDAWSAREDAEIAEWLRRLVRPDDTVVDLGCGQGLGFRLLQQSAAPVPVKYVGVDLSAGMLDLAAAAASDGLLLQGDIARVPLADSCADLVISVNSAVSYLADPTMVFKEIKRLLAPDGRYLLMCLSRFSLSRLRRAQTASVGPYGTGSVEAGPLTSAPARFLSQRELLALLQRSDLAVGTVFGQSPFRSRHFVDSRWFLSRTLGALLPDLGHALVAVGNNTAH